MDILSPLTHYLLLTIEALKKAARVNQIRLSPEEVMIYFEIAAKIAFGKNRSITSVASTVSNNPNVDQNEVICDLCSKICKKRGLKKHRNDCLKKPQNWSINRVIN
jgi:hypothetical protein